MKATETKCFEIYKECVKAIHDGELIIQESQKDKEFHFQNWCQARLENVGVHFEGTDWRFPGVKKIMMLTATSPQGSITEDIFSIFLGGTQVIQGLIKKVVSQSIL